MDQWTVAERIVKDVLPIITLLIGLGIGSVVQARREKRARQRKGIEAIWRAAQRAADGLESVRTFWGHLKPGGPQDRNEDTRLRILTVFDAFRQTLTSLKSTCF